MADVARPAFLARMSHEMRTPLNAIIGLNHLLLSSATDARQREQVEKVLAAAKQLLSLVDEVFELSRLEAGEVNLVGTDFQPAQLIAAVMQEVEKRAGAQGLALAMEVAPGVPYNVRGDARRLHEVLLHFADNAVKFTERGSITLRVAVVAQDAAAVRLRFGVTDTGAGLDARQRERLFDAFEQLEGSVARRYGGTGLGLAICRRIATLMGGAVGVDSRRGEGSTFWFEAPFQDVAGTPLTAAPVATPVPGASHAASRRLLLADDDALNREVGASLLQLEGFDVDTAEDGAAAVDLALRGPYAAILLDLQMPGLDGIGAALAIRHLPQHRATPIIALTAGVLDDVREACEAAGINDLMAKPVDPAQLSLTLARWTSTSPGEGPAALRAAPNLDAEDRIEQQRGQVRELRRLVAADEYSALREWRQLSPQVLGRSHEAIGNAIENFDYEAAERLLGAWLEESEP